MNPIKTRDKTFVVLALTLLVVAPSYAAGLGATLRAMADNTFGGAMYFIKYGAALLGLIMAAYAIYGLTWGRKGDEREYPVGSMLMILMGGALLLSLGLVLGIFNETALGESAESEIELLDGDGSGSGS